MEDVDKLEALAPPEQDVDRGHPHVVHHDEDGDGVDEHPVHGDALDLRPCPSVGQHRALGGEDVVGHRVVQGAHQPLVVAPAVVGLVRHVERYHPGYSREGSLSTVVAVEDCADYPDTRSFEEAADNGKLEEFEFLIESITCIAKLFEKKIELITAAFRPLRYCSLDLSYLLRNSARHDVPQAPCCAYREDGVEVFGAEEAEVEKEQDQRQHLEEALHKVENFHRP